MKSFILVIIGFVFLNSNLYSQKVLVPQLYINSGITMPIYPEYFNDYWNSGINVGGGLNIPVFSLLNIQLGFQYNSFLFDDLKWLDELDKYLLSIGEDEISDELIISGAMKNILLISLNLKIDYSLFGGSLNPNPYLIGGLGMIYNNTDNLVVGGLEVDFKEETRFAGGIGAGVDIRLNKETNIFIEGFYMHGLTKEENNQEIPMEIGGAYKEKEIGYFYFKLGVSYNLSKN